MIDLLAINEGRLEQRAGEQITYGITTTPWGSSPSSPATVAYDITDRAAPNLVTATVLDGTAGAAGDVITLPTLQGLVAGRTYEIRTTFTDGDSNVWVVVFEVLGVR